MKRFLHTFSLLLLATCSLFAQNPSRVDIKGVAKDTLGNELAYATVMLLNPKDTTLANFTRSDDKGAFSFNNVKNVPYLLKISYIGYIPLQQYLPVSEKGTNDLGELIAKPISKELMEVVIKTAKAPLRIHGDTVEYDATTFKVPPGSTVEDLLRRLPGIELDADGNIKAQGKDVNKVYVDGKTFFSDDPKAATKNLGAETISKVQVYDEKSEQTRLTGVDDGKKDKVMNLELKNEFKKGSFGKVTAAAGTENRWAGRASYNRFNEKEQLSFIGYGNNINQTGVNWEDYGEFKGQNTFNNEDNGDFGFGQGGGRYFIITGDDDSPLGWFDGRGFTKNFGAGANYNFDNKKTKFNLSYFYNQSELTLDQFSERQTFLADTSFFNTDTVGNLNFRGSHAVSTRLEQDIDSSNTIIVKLNGRIGNTHSDYLQSQLFSNSDYQPTNRLNIDNAGKGDNWRVAASGIYRHKFKKKGRSFAWSGGYNGSNTDGTENLYNENELLASIVRQDNDNANNTQQFKSSLLYTEPLSKTWFWETFYNFNNTRNDVNRQVADPENAGQRIDSLSVFYENTTLYNRIGTVVRYAKNGLNLSAGLAGQQIQLDGSYAVDRGEPIIGEPVSRKYNNLVPDLDFNYEFKNNLNLETRYNYNVREPQLSQLQPVPNVNNPVYRTLGNPDLAPETSHSVNFSINYWNPANFSNFNLWSGLSFFDNQIVNSQTNEFVDGLVRVTSRPENVSGGRAFSTGFWSNYPIIKTKFSVRLNGNISLNHSPVFVDALKTTTNSNNYSLGLGFSITPSTKLIVELNGDLDYTHTTYESDQTLTQKPESVSGDVSVKWQFIDKTFLESNFNYSRYENERLQFNREVGIWNASVRRLVGKKNRFEIRLAAFDLLNQRVTINQSATLNYVTRSVAPTLARYVMLSVSYNVRGYENKLKDRRRW